MVRALESGSATDVRTRFGWQRWRSSSSPWDRQIGDRSAATRSARKRKPFVLDAVKQLSDSPREKEDAGIIVRDPKAE
jgi:hypothetical protein